MKRKALDTKESPQAKRPKESTPDYCHTQPRKDDDGSILWPASREAIDRARDFIRECAISKEQILIVPDKDADGLDAGVIIHRTLTALGAEPSSINVHLVAKGRSIHDDEERKSMGDRNPKYVIVVDQGSRPAPPVVDSPDVKSLIIDHHLSDEFPKDALTLHPDIPTSCGYLCAMGTHGDLGNTLKWDPPFPDMKEVFKTHTKKAINDAVSLLNAPRRTAQFDVSTAWSALLTTTSPKTLLTNPRLLSARAEINAEVARHTHTPPKFTQDGKIAVLRIRSAAQVHPVIATRWAGHLKSAKLEIVLVANEGYLPGM
ncbi:MAG: hypothetical protein Q9223_007689, partial [Gallowayella weberi]